METIKQREEQFHQYSEQIIAIERYIQELQNNVDLIAKEIEVYRQVLNDFDFNEIQSIIKKMEEEQPNTQEIFDLLNEFRPKNKRSIVKAKNLIETHKDFLSGVIPIMMGEYIKYNQKIQDYRLKIQKLASEQDEIVTRIEQAKLLIEALRNGSAPEEVLTSNYPSYIRSLFN